MGTEDETGAKKKERPEAVGIPAAAALLAAGFGLSRILGFGREVLLANFFGLSLETDAYFTAFILPEILNYMLAGGALSIAFLPFYTRALAKEEEDGGEGAERLLATMLGNLGLLVVVLTGVLWWKADVVLGFAFHQFDESTLDLTVELTRIVLPAQIFFVIGGVLKTTLFARGRFGAAALAPLIYNLCIIVFGVLLRDAIGVRGFAWGVLIGAFLGPFLVPCIDAMRRVKIRFRFAPLDAVFLSYLVIAAPLMLGQSLLTVDELFDKYFGHLLGEGAIAALSFARKLMLAPVSVVGQAIATAALPTMARLWEEGGKDELDTVVQRSLQAGLSLAILGGVAFCLFANPIVRLMYQHGAFDAADTELVAYLLAVMAFAVPAWIVQQIIVRPFYARGDMWRPMLLGTFVVILALPLYWWLSKEFGVKGLAVAGIIGMSGNALLTLLLARRLHGAPKFPGLVITGLRTAAIALVAGWISVLLIALFFGASNLWPGSELDLRTCLGILVLGGTSFGVVAFGLGLRFGDEPTREVLRKLLAKVTRRHVG